MSKMRVSDPSRLHLKKELTQIRKAARVLRDPGTTSSWKSPLSSSRSAAVAAALPTSASTSKRFENGNGNGNDGAHFDSQFKNGCSKQKRVFLYNWKTQKSAMARSDAEEEEDEEEHYAECSSIQESFDDSLSDARHVGGDSRSETYLSEARSASRLFRCGDASLISPSVKAKKMSKQSNAHLDVLSRYEQKELNLRRLLKSHPSVALGLGRDHSVEQSDETEEYRNSEDSRKILGASPLLSKLKHKNWSRSPSRLLKRSRKEDSSYCCSTPALSTSSYNRYYNCNPSIVGSWDATTTSLNDADDEVNDHLDFPGRQGCGIPCYWSKRPMRHRGVCGSCCSPSLSDTLGRKGSSMLCGSQPKYGRRRRKIASRGAQGLLPLLPYRADGIGGSSLGTGQSEDELSSNFGELNLEGLSRLDGRRWSSCRSQDGLEIVALCGEGEDGSPDNIGSLSQKYKPIFFGELIGQNIVVQSLINAISRGRIAPVYLFQGPRGTGKTSTARIFASALNCLSPKEAKPCGCCRMCSEFISGKTINLWEVDGSNKKGIDKVRHLLKKISHGLPSISSSCKVLIIDECHLLPSKMWLAFLKYLEEPPPQVVFIFITTDPDNVPRTVQSRCQKYLFNKIKDGDIVARLRKISTEENLNVELEALDLIALNADGSLRDAETMLDQLSLLGKRITTSLVNELVGFVSDDKLLELLELAMSSNTAETVKRARDLMDSGVDPMVLMSQLASLIMDIIAGTYNDIDTKRGDSFFGGRSLTEAELERLRNALKLLSEAEKQLRVSSDHSTWFAATLLQLGSVPLPEFTQTSSSRRQSSRTTEEDPSSASIEALVYKRQSDSQCLPQRSISSHPGEIGSNGRLAHNQYMDDQTPSASLDGKMIGNMLFKFKISDELNNIWGRCIEKCHSKTLRQLLHAHGRLLSISEVEGVLVAYIAFGDEVIKARAERFLSSITNSIEMVLRQNVEVRLILVADVEGSMNCVNQLELQDQKQTEATSAIWQERKATQPNVLDGYSDLGSQQESKLSRGSFNDVEGIGDYSKSSTFSAVLPLALLSENNAEGSGVKAKTQEIPLQRVESIIHEQRLETAWLQAVEKGTPGSLSHLKPEKNQVLPQEDIYHQNQTEPTNTMGLSSQHAKDEINEDLKFLKAEDRLVLHKDQFGKRVDCHPISPSLLHGNGLGNKSNKESQGYESSSGGRGCSALFCWNTKKPCKPKAKGTPVHVRSRHKGRQFSLFSQCAKHKKAERSRR